MKVDLERESSRAAGLCAEAGLGYTCADWPGEYVAWDMSMLLATVPERMDSLRDRQVFMAWLAGRGNLDPAIALRPWG